ncbi:MAG: hypothetical protein ACOCUS_05045 [Polyangiales bacterium]
MTAQRALREGPIGRAVQEALRAVAAPEQRERIMSAALQLARAKQVPEDPQRAQGFVEGPLRVAVGHTLGADIADVLVQDLAPILQLAESQVRPRNEPARSRVEAQTKPELPPAAQKLPSTQPPPTSDATDAPLVLVATLDRSGLQRLARRLVDTATVRPVNDVFELLYALEANAARHPMVVIDCCLPAVEPQAVASMLGGLAEPPRVLLWGAARSVRDGLEATSSATRDWIALGSEATDEDVVSLIESML